MLCKLLGCSMQIRPVLFSSLPFSLSLSLDPYVSRSLMCEHGGNNASFSMSNMVVAVTPPPSLQHSWWITDLSGWLDDLHWNNAYCIQYPGGDNWGLHMSVHAWFGLLVCEFGILRCEMKGGVRLRERDLIAWYFEWLFVFLMLPNGISVWRPISSGGLASYFGVGMHYWEFFEKIWDLREVWKNVYAFSNHESFAGLLRGVWEREHRLRHLPPDCYWSTGTRRDRGSRKVCRKAWLIDNQSSIVERVPEGVVSEKLNCFCSWGAGDVIDYRYGYKGRCTREPEPLMESRCNTSNQKPTFRCVNHAVAVRDGRRASAFCRADGKWQLTGDGACHCKPGYFPTSIANTCAGLFGRLLGALGVFEFFWSLIWACICVSLFALWTFSCTTRLRYACF